MAMPIRTLLCAFDSLKDKSQNSRSQAKNFPQFSSGPPISLSKFGLNACNAVASLWVPELIHEVNFK